MTPVGPEASAGGLRVALRRGALLLALWLVLTDVTPALLLPGLGAAALATWMSLRLAPPGRLRPRPAALARLSLDMLRQMLVAGGDVAWRALDPRLPIRPGLVTVRLRLPAGGERDGFTTLMSLAPGTLPIAADAEGRLVVHCLDVAADVAVQVARQERRWTRALGLAPADA